MFYIEVVKNVKTLEEKSHGSATHLSHVVFLVSFLWTIILIVTPFECLLDDNYYYKFLIKMISRVSVSPFCTCGNGRSERFSGLLRISKLVSGGAKV